MKKILWLCIAVMLLSSFGGLSSALAVSPLKKVSNDLIGIHYKYGGTTTRGFDCSGMVSFVYKKFGVKLPHQSRSMAALGTKIKKTQLKAGDLVFFRGSSRSKQIGHVGVYLGNGKFMHSSSSRGVVQDSMNDKHWKSFYLMSRRVLSSKQYAKITDDSKFKLADLKKKKPVAKIKSKKSASKSSKKSNKSNKKSSNKKSSNKTALKTKKSSTTGGAIKSANKQPVAKTKVLASNKTKKSTSKKSKSKKSKSKKSKSKKSTSKKLADAKKVKKSTKSTKHKKAA